MTGSEPIREARESRDLATGLGRARIVAGLYLLGVANGLAGGVVESVLSHGFWGALTITFDVSIIVVGATAVGVTLTVRGADRPIDGWDRVIGAIYLLALAVPLSGASWAALTFLAVCESLRHRRSTEAVAAASLFIGIAVTRLWGGVVLNLLAAPLLAVDTTMVATLLSVIQGGGVEHAANLIETAEGQPLAIFISCSSLSQVSSGLLCWMAIVRAVRPAWRWSDAWTALIVVASVMTLNVPRMTLMGVSHDWYLLFHGPVGAQIYNALVLVAATAAAWRALAANAPPRPALV